MSFRQVIGIPMGTNCAPLLADLFLYSYEGEFLHNMIRGGHRKLARSFNLCYRYTDDLIVFNNKKFEDYVKEIYPSQLTVEKANTSDDLANYLDLIFIIESNISTLHQALWQTWWFWFPHCQFSIPFKQYPILPFIWCLYFPVDKICKVLLILWWLWISP